MTFPVRRDAQTIVDRDALGWYRRRGAAVWSYDVETERGRTLGRDVEQEALSVGQKIPAGGIDVVDPDLSRRPGSRGNEIELSGSRLRQNPVPVGRGRARDLRGRCAPQGLRRSGDERSRLGPLRPWSSMRIDLSVLGNVARASGDHVRSFEGLSWASYRRRGQPPICVRMTRQHGRPEERSRQHRFPARVHETLSRPGQGDGIDGSNGLRWRVRNR